MYKKKPVKQESKAKSWIIVGTVLLSVIGSGWLAFGYFRGDEMAALNALREQMRDESLTGDQRRELWGQMRTEMEKLSPDQRRDMWQSRELERNREMQNRLGQFFAMAPADRDKELDKQIDQMEKWRKDREKQRRERGDGDRGDRGDRGGRERGNGDAGGGGGGGGGPGGGGRGGPRTGADRLQRSKERLNSTTPELRSMRSDYFRAMQDRRQARGLPPMRGGRGGWG